MANKKRLTERWPYVVTFLGTINIFQGFMWSHSHSRNSSRFFGRALLFAIYRRRSSTSLFIADSFRRQAQSCRTPWSLDPKNRSIEARIRERMNPDSEFVEYNRAWVISVLKFWLRRTKSVRENFVSMTLRLLNTTKKLVIIQLWRTHTSKQNAKKKIFCLFKAIKQSLPI